MKILTEHICKVSHPYLYDNVETNIFRHETNQALLILYVCIFYGMCFDEIFQSSPNLQTYICKNRETLQKVSLRALHEERM